MTGALIPKGISCRASPPSPIPTATSTATTVQFSTIRNIKIYTKIYTQFPIAARVSQQPEATPSHAQARPATPDTRSDCATAANSCKTAAHRDKSLIFAPALPQPLATARITAPALRKPRCHNCAQSAQSAQPSESACASQRPEPAGANQSPQSQPNSPQSPQDPPGDRRI